MKKTVASLAIAGMIVTTVPNVFSMNIANAASVNPTQAPQTLVIDGIKNSISSISLKGKTIYSVKEIAKHMKAKYLYDDQTKTYKLVLEKKVITFKPNTQYIMSNGKKVSLNVPISTKNKLIYMDLEPLVTGLGGDILTNPLTKEKFIATKGLVSANVSNVRWVDQQHILFSDEENNVSYLLNVQNKQIKKQFNGSEYSLSPNGKLAVYTDEKDALYLLDLQSSKSTILSSDDTYKSEFVWSNDGSKIFFLQGDKGEMISSISLKDGSITKILDDKVEYKSDLQLSVDGTKILYTAAKQAVTKYTDDTKSDVDTIDTSGTEPQIFVLDTLVSTPTPVAITSSKENKFFITPLFSGRILYLEVSAEDDKKLPTLKIQDGSFIKSLVSDKQIEGLTVSSNGGIYLLVTETDGRSSIYKVSNGSLKKIITTNQEISSMEISKDGKQLLVTVSTENGEKIAVVKNGTLEDLTKN